MNSEQPANEPIAWNVEQLVQNATATRTADVMAVMIATFYQRLCKRGFEHEDAMELTHQFLVAYISASFEFPPGMHRPDEENDADC